MADVNKRYFEGLMGGKDISLRGLAKEMGMSHSQLSLTFSGDRRMQLSEASQLSTFFNRPLHEIVENAGISISTLGGHRVSVIGALRGDGTIEMTPKGVVDRTSAPEGVPKDGVAVQARTAGSALDWIDGAVFFMPPLSGVDPAITGRFALVQIKEGPIVLATVRRGYRENTVNLSGPYTKENAVIEAATPVLWTRN